MVLVVTLAAAASGGDRCSVVCVACLVLLIVCVGMLLIVCVGMHPCMLLVLVAMVVAVATGFCG